MSDQSVLLITVSEAARRLSCSRSLLYEILGDGQIRSVKLGKKRLVEVASLEAFAASLPESPLQTAKESSCR
jgi:excisionase family DNA binding protein